MLLSFCAISLPFSCLVSFELKELHTQCTQIHLCFPHLFTLSLQTDFLLPFWCLVERKKMNDICDLISMAPNWWGVLNANCIFNTKRMGWNLCFSHNIIATRSDRGAVGWLIFNYLGRSHCELVRAFSAWIYRFPIMWGWEGGRQDRDREYAVIDCRTSYAPNVQNIFAKPPHTNRTVSFDHTSSRTPTLNRQCKQSETCEYDSMGGRRERDEK